jgi:ATP synthase proteolipid subunit
MVSAVAEKPESFSKGMITVVLAEALAIYGLLASFMLLMRISSITNEAQGLVALGAGLAIGLACIGAGIGIARAGSAMATSTAAEPQTFSKALVSVVLAEALAIYGLLTSFMLLMRIETATFIGQGLVAIAAGLGIGLAALGAGIGISKTGAALNKALVTAPESFSKGLVGVVLAEALGIYGLLASFMLLMRIESVTVESQGFIAIAAALGVGLAALGAGIGIASSGASLSESLTRRPEVFSKGLVSVVLAEALGIYGLLSSFMLLMRIETATVLAQGLVGVGAGLAVGIAGLGAGIGIASAGGALSKALVEAPESFSKGLVSVVLAEALGIYGLLASFMLLMRIDTVTLNAQGLLAIAASIGVGFAAFGAGLGIAAAGAALSQSLVDRPEVFSKGLVSVVLAEALGIYGLLASFMLLMRIETVTIESQGLVGLAASLAIGLAAIGAGIGIARAGSSINKTLVTAPETFSKGLVSVVLAEALGIYGLLASFMLLMRIETATNIGQGYMGLAAAISVGVAGLGAGFGIAYAGYALSQSLGERPEVFSKGLIGVVLAEALAIYGLLAGFMLLMRIDTISSDITIGSSQGIIGIGAGLAIGLAAVGAGIGIARAGASMSRTIVHAPETFSKSLVSVVLAEALGIYGLLTSFMLLMRIDSVTQIGQSIVAIAAGLAIGLAALGAGFGIAAAGAALSRSLAARPEVFSKGLVSVVLAEALGIYGLLASFMLLMRIETVTDVTPGLLAIGASMSIGLAAIGAGLGIAASGSALSEGLVHRPEIFSKGLVAVVLAEALGIYGLLSSFMLLMRIETVTSMGQGLVGIGAGAAIGLAAIGGGLGIAMAGAALSHTLVTAPEVFSKGLVSVVLAEALGIYGLLMSFMLIMRIDTVTDPSQGLMAMGTALAVGFACFGAGFGIAHAGSALARTIAAEPGAFSKGLVAVVLAEALGIYGLLVGFMVVMRVETAALMAQGWLAVGAGLAIGIAGVGGGLGIGYSGGALCTSIRSAPESFSKGLVAVVLAEALGIYGLLTAFMLVMRLDAIADIGAFIGVAAAGTVGLGTLMAGIAIGWAGAGLIGAIGNKPGIFSKSMVPVVLAEALAIYALLVAFMLIMRI